MIKSTVISVGDELLIGQVINTNAAWISKYLIQFGIKTVEHLVVSDTEQGIHDGLARSLSTSEVIIMTGGLGPTKDDITKVALCSFLNLELEFNDVLYDQIQKAFKKRNIPLRESHRLQCYLPKGIRLLENRLGTAPGMLMEHEGKYVISLPGVPYEMKNILTHGGSDFLNGIKTDHVYFQKTLMTAGMGETSIAEIIDPVINEMPEYFKVAYLPSYGTVRIRLSSAENAPNIVLEEGEEYIQKMSALLGNLLYGFDDIPLSKALGALLVKRSLKMAVAESCTGGMISQKITSIAGSSNYYIGGIVAYANEVKQNQLNVSEQTLRDYGAVSEQTVKEMLRGLLNTLHADIGISISGIAGPGGGSKEKPVGTIWICYGSLENMLTKKIFINRNREVNIQYASGIALNLLRNFVLNTY